MYRVYGLRLGPNFVVQLAAVQNFHLRLTVEGMHAFVDIYGHTVVATQILRLR